MGIENLLGNASRVPRVGCRGGLDRRQRSRRLNRREGGDEQQQRVKYIASMNPVRRSEEEICHGLEHEERAEELPKMADLMYKLRLFGCMGPSQTPGIHRSCGLVSMPPCFSTRYDPQGSVISQRIRAVQLIFAALLSEPFTLSLDFFMYVFIYTNFTGWLQFRRPGKPTSLSWGTSRCHRRSHRANALLLDGIEHQNGALGANS